jgi:hypothetical protein
MKNFESNRILELPKFITVKEVEDLQRRKVTRKRT